MSLKATSLDMLSHMDFEDAIKELESYEPCEETLVTHEGSNVVDDDMSIQFNDHDLWMSTLNMTNCPVPRVLCPKSESK
eukprot:3267591-Prymnesium_polylepis.1